MTTHRHPGNAKGAQATVYDMRAAVDNIFRRLGVNPQELKGIARQ